MDYEIAEISNALVNVLESLQPDKKAAAISNCVEFDSNSTNDCAPGTIYNQKADWDCILTDAGWCKLGDRSDNTSDWRRPGKLSGGLSGTVGYCGERFYNFSSSVEGLECDRGYTKFEFFTFVYHKGDFSAAASELSRLGYIETMDVKIAEIFSDTSSTFEAEIREEGIELDTLQKVFEGTLIESVAKYHALRNTDYDLTSGYVVGIALQSWLLGRVVKLQDGTRPNLFLMYTALTGSGKTAAIDTLRSILRELGEAQAIDDGFASAQALEDAFADNPKHICVFEEFQDTLQAATNVRGGPLAGLASTLKKIFTANKIDYSTRSRAHKPGEASGSVSINEPFLVVLATGIYDKIWCNITETMMTDGFITRMALVNMAEYPQANKVLYEDSKLFDSIIARCKQWLAMKPNMITPSENSDFSVGRIDPLNILQNEESIRLATEFKARCNKKRDALKNTIGAAAWSRTHETMCKCMLLISGGHGPNTTIDGDMTLKACRFAETNTRAILFNMLNKDIDAEWYNVLKGRVLRALDRYTTREKPCLNWRELQRATHLQVAKLAAVIPSMASVGDILTTAAITPDELRMIGKGSWTALTKYEKEFKEHLLKEKGISDEQN